MSALLRIERNIFCKRFASNPLSAVKTVAYSSKQSFVRRAHAEQLLHQQRAMKFFYEEKGLYVHV